MVGPIVLWIELPDKRLTSPQGAYQRILAAHEVEIGCPQQFIKRHLLQPRHGVQHERAPARVPLRLQRMRQGIRQNGPYRLQRTPRRDQRMHPSPMRPAVQMLHQLRQSGRFVAKQAQHVCIFRHTPLCAPGGAVKRLLPQQQIGLAQQAAGLWRKAGIEKILHAPGCRSAHHR